MNILALVIHMVLVAPATPTSPTAKAATTPPASTTAPTLGTSSDSLAAYNRVLLMPLSSLGSTEEAVGAIERILSDEMQKLLGAKLITYANLGQSNRRMRDQLGACDQGLDCILEVAGAYGWRHFVIGNIAGLGGDRVINLKLIDAVSGGEVRGASEKANGDERQLIGQMRKAVVTLLAPELFAGILEVNAAQPGLRILVDGQLMGTTPLANPRLSVPAGRRAVEATGEGMVPFSSMIEVAYGEVVPLDINLPENTVFVGGSTPYRARWYTWAMAGAGALGVGLGAYFNKQHLDSVHHIESLARDGQSLTYDHASLLDDSDRQFKTAVVFYGAGGSLLLGSGILLLLDLF